MNQEELNKILQEIITLNKDIEHLVFIANDHIGKPYFGERVKFWLEEICLFSANLKQYRERLDKFGLYYTYETWTAHTQFHVHYLARACTKSSDFEVALYEYSIPVFNAIDDRIVD